MVTIYIGRAGIVGTGVHRDHAGKRVEAQQLLGAEVGLQQPRDRARYHPLVDLAVAATKPPTELGLSRRCGEDRLLIESGESAHLQPEPHHPGRIATGEPFDGSQLPVELGIEDERAPVLPDADPIDAGPVVPQPVPIQLQVTRDPGPQQTEHDRPGGEPEAGNELLGHADSADHRAPLDDGRPMPGAGEIPGRHETVVPSPDDDGVVALSYDVSPITPITRRRRGEADGVTGDIALNRNAAVNRAARGDARSPAQPAGLVNTSEPNVLVTVAASPRRAKRSSDSQLASDE